MKSLVLYLMISLSGMVFGAEIVASHITQSIVLLVSAYHMLYNILSLLLLVISYRMSKEKTMKNTFGWARVKVLGLLVNMLFLSALCFSALVESVQTIVHASHEDTIPRYPMLMVILGAVNFIVNIICFTLIGGYTHHQGCSMTIKEDDMQVNCIVLDSVNNRRVCSNSLRSSFEYLRNTRRSGFYSNHQVLDVSRDVSSCLVVIVCGCILLLMNGLILKYADAILAIASVTVLYGSTYPFIREFGLIMLQSIPSHIDVSGLTRRLLIEFPDILNVHHLHVWRHTNSEIIATVHILLRSPDIYTRIDKTLTQFFRDEGISSVTVQPEFTNGDLSEVNNSECILQCSVSNNCKALTCCGPITGGPECSARLRCNANEAIAFAKENNLNQIPNKIENNLYHLEQMPAKVENHQNNLYLYQDEKDSEFFPLTSDYDFSTFRTTRETTM
ncbi:proton-coupled zinc antiporter SLC30A1 [Parasteatoda tepidariorum]|uniref:proton-coupled zinc antiporter SLC30A1 n=1 Tax=Parasteatoda tepidariorum TaxID=114398 RepID=UPI0039BCB3EB